MTGEKNKACGEKPVPVLLCPL